jgi:DNA-binding XRE family transcriptional regulator
MKKKKASAAARRVPKAVKIGRPAPIVRRPSQEILKLVGARIREVRKQRGLSQDHLAYSIPMDRAHVGLVENGKRSATILTLVKIARALECEVGDLFPYLEEMEPYVDWDRG